MPRGIYLRTEAHRKKISLEHRIITEEDEKVMMDMYKNNMSPSDISKIFPYRRCAIKDLMKRRGIIRTQSEASKLAVKQGKKDKAIKNLIIASKTTNRFNPSKSNKGKKNSRWLGDRKLLKRPMTSFEGNQWRKEIYKRDNFTCQKCGKKGVRLNAHHIRGFFECPNLKWDINNGITLCINCHKKTNNYGWKSINQRRNVVNYISVKTS